MKVSDKLRGILYGPGWTQQKVAERIGVSQSTVARWMKGTEPEGHHRDAVSDLYAEVKGYAASEGMMKVGFSVTVGGLAVPVEPAEQEWTFIPPRYWFGGDAGMSAIKVETTDLLPLYDWGSVLYHSERGNPSDLIGEVCVVYLVDGRTMVRAVHYGPEPDKWHLTFPGLPDVRGVKIEWVSPIRWVKTNSDYIPF